MSAALKILEKARLDAWEEAHQLGLAAAAGEVSEQTYHDALEVRYQADIAYHRAVREAKEAKFPATVSAVPVAAVPVAAVPVVMAPVRKSSLSPAERERIKAEVQAEITAENHHEAAVAAAKQFAAGRRGLAAHHGRF